MVAETTDVFSMSEESELSEVVPSLEVLISPDESSDEDDPPPPPPPPPQEIMRLQKNNTSRSPLKSRRPLSP